MFYKTFSWSIDNHINPMIWIWQAPSCPHPFPNFPYLLTLSLLFSFKAHFNFLRINICYSFSCNIADFGYVLRNFFHNLNPHSALHFLVSPSEFLLFFFFNLKIFSPSGIHFSMKYEFNTVFPETISSLSQHVLRLILPILIDLKRRPYPCTSSHVLLWHFLWASRHEERWWHLLGEALWA